MKIHNAEKPQIIRHYEKGTSLYFNEKDKKFKALNCWEFKINKNAKTQINRLINLDKCKIDKDIVKSIVESYANENFKDVIFTAKNNKNYICIRDNDSVKIYYANDLTATSIGDGEYGEFIDFEFSTKCKDSQGVEIFENDIIEYKIAGKKAKKPYRDIVIFDTDTEIPCFRTKRLGKNAFCFGKSLYDEIESIKVIGNIHEHPHLVPYKKRQKNEDKEDKQ